MCALRRTKREGNRIGEIAGHSSGEGEAAVERMGERKGEERFSLCRLSAHPLPHHTHTHTNTHTHHTHTTHTRHTQHTHTRRIAYALSASHCIQSIQKSRASAASTRLLFRSPCLRSLVSFPPAPLARSRPRYPWLWPCYSLCIKLFPRLFSSQRRCLAALFMAHPPPLPCPSTLSPSTLRRHRTTDTPR